MLSDAFSNVFHLYPFIIIANSQEDYLIPVVVITRSTQSKQFNFIVEKS